MKYLIAAIIPFILFFAFGFKLQTGEPFGWFCVLSVASVVTVYGWNYLINEK